MHLKFIVYLQLHHENCIHLHILHVIKITKVKSSNLQDRLAGTELKKKIEYKIPAIVQILFIKKCKQKGM
jgi:hypothetical protein